MGSPVPFLKSPVPKTRGRLQSEFVIFCETGSSIEAFIKHGLVLTKQEEAILVKSGLIFINAVRLLDAVESAFAEVCYETRTGDDTAPIRRAFDTYWNQMEWKQAKKLEPNAITETGLFARLFNKHSCTRPC